MCDTWEAFTGTQDARLVTVPVPVSRPVGLSEFPRKVIAGWEPFDDTPHPPEHEMLGLQYEYDFQANTVAVECDDPPLKKSGISMETDVAESIATAEQGDKLGGWPMWIQGMEYPSCPICGQVMQLLMQVDSEDNIPHMFGDAGCAHLTICKDHPDQLGFGWACG